MNHDSTLYVGLDVHKDSITVAYAMGLDEVELFGKIGTTQSEVDRLCKRLQSKARHVQVQLVASFSRSSNLSESCVRTGFPGRLRNRLQFRFLDAANDRKPLLANDSHKIEP